MKLTLTTIASGLALTTASALAQQPGAAAVHHAIHHVAHHHAALHHAAVLAAHQQDAKAKAKAKADASASGKLSVVSSESMDGDQDGKVIELRVEDGKVTVKRNGEEIPQDRIRHEDDGRIIILDENGKELDDVHLFHGGHGGQLFKGDLGGEGLGNFYRFRAGQGVDGEGNLLWTGDEDGEAPKVMLGVHMGEPVAALEKHLNLDAGKTCIITGVFEGLPAEVAGIGEHDIIVKIDDSDSADASSIRKILTGKNPGDTCTLHVIQAGKAKDLKIKLQAYDAEKLGSAKLIGKDPESSMWRSLQPLHDMNVNLEGLQNLPQLRDRVFVSPDSFKSAEEWKALLPRLQGTELKMEELQPQIQKALQDALKNYEGAIKLYQGDRGGGEAKPGGEDVENQLDRLDKRMEQLEQMLQKLLERQPKP